MRSLCFAALGLSVAGCVWDAPSRRAPAEYLSTETYGAAHWGMRESELRVAVADLVPCGEASWCREEELEGRPARVSYELFRGRLAQIRLAVASSSPVQDFQRLGRDLVSAYGVPVEAKGLASQTPSASSSVTRAPWSPASVLNLVIRAAPPTGALVAEWVTPETELWLLATPVPRAWLQLTLTSRALGLLH
jgi:hypothetical protein